MSSPEELLVSIEKHLKENPNDAKAWNAKGVVLAQTEDFGAALRSLDRAIRLDGDLAEAHTNRGRVLMAINQDNARDALASFRRALELKPDDRVTLADMSIALRVLGQSQEELICISRLVELETDVPELWIRKGNLEMEVGNPRHSVTSYERALALNENSPSAWIYLSLAFSRLEEHKDAVKAAKKATRIAPDRVESWRVLAEANIRVDKLKSAMKALKKAAEIDPTDTHTRNAMGMVAYKAGKLSEAAKHFRRCLTIDRTNISALRNMGLIMMELEEWEKAAKAWNRLTPIVRDDAFVWDVAATTFARLNDFCSAHQAWEKARKILSKSDNKDEYERVRNLARAARINCSRQKKAEKAQREHEKATRTFDDRLSRRRRRK